MQKNTRLQRNDHQSLQAMIIDRWQMFFFERRRIEKLCQKLIKSALPFGGKERRRISLSGLLAHFILYKVWSNCSVKSHHLFGTGFIFPVSENLKNRLYCDIYFLTHCLDISCFTFEGVFPFRRDFQFRQRHSFK